MIINIIRHQSTAKSGPNTILLSRLRQIQINSETKLESPKHRKTEIDDVKRSLTPQRLLKLLNYHYEDPLVWNTSILGKIFNIPEWYCDRLVNYVRPMIYKSDTTMSEAEKLIETKIVIDVERLKRDKSYMKLYQRLVFIDADVKKIEQKSINKKDLVT